MDKQEILRKLKIENLDLANQDRILNNIASLVNDRLLLEISDKLDDKDLEKISDMIDRNQDDQVEWYIKSKFEHYEEYAKRIEESVIDELAKDNAKFIEQVHEDRKASAAADNALLDIPTS